MSHGANGEVLATLSTALSGGVNRAILDTLVPLETDPPTIVIETPGEGTIYTLNEDVVASYVCSNPAGVVSCSGPVADGSPIDTSSLGSHVFTVSAQDSLGNSGSLTHTYRVATECSNGIDDDGDGAIDFDGGASANQGVAFAPADEGCDGSGASLSESPSPDPEVPPRACGLGSELGVVLPALLWLRARRTRAGA